MTWDSLADTFDSYSSDDAVAVDNRLLIWPMIEESLKHLPKNTEQKILDFGCGTGEFVDRLKNLGFEAIGFDSSVKMIQFTPEFKTQYSVKSPLITGLTFIRLYAPHNRVLEY